jgi:hypothetical protein
MIKIQWWNSTDFGNTLYSRGFRQQLFLDTVLGTPEILEVIVGDSDGEGGVIPSFQKRAKQYKFEVFVPEFLIDALNDIRLHDNINITDELGVVYEVTNRSTFEVGDGTWSNTGCNKLLTISFQTGERIIRTNCPVEGCEEEIEKTDCTSTAIIADYDLWQPLLSEWSLLSINGPFNDYDLTPQHIQISDTAGLETHLNSLGIGTWNVTLNGAGTVLTITNTQDLPANNLFISICFEALLAPPNAPCYVFTTDC